MPANPYLQGTLNLVGDSLQGTASVVVTPDWVDGTYELADVVATTMYDRVSLFLRDGSVQSSSGAPIAAGTTPRLDGIRFTVAGATANYRPPVITSLTRPGPSAVAPSEMATFSATFTPGSAPLTSLRVRLRGFRPYFVELSPLAGGMASGVFSPSSDWNNGLYAVDQVQAIDSVGNIVIYDNLGAISDLGVVPLGQHTLDLTSLNLGVTVVNATAAPVLPRLTQLALTNGPSIRAGDNASLAFAVTPGTSPIASVTFTFNSSASDAERISVQAFDVASGVATLRVPHDVAGNRYQLNNVVVVDRQSRLVNYSRNGRVDMTGVSTPPPHNFNFSALDFNVVAPQPGRLANLAVRSTAGADAQTLIVGFTVGGAGTSGTKPLLMRGIGPALASFGLAGVLSDPMLGIYSGSSKILENDNWGGDSRIVALAASVGAFALPESSVDSALLLTADSASYSAQITGKNNATGVALAEIYDATPTAEESATTPRLTNLSTRAQVGTGSEILIAGFTISGGPRTVLVRAIGPSLALFGVNSALANPRLAIFSGANQIAANDDWSGDPALAAAFTATGAFALASNSTDAAVVVTLPPGSYTAQVNGVNNTAGVALAEVYEVP